METWGAAELGLGLGLDEAEAVGAEGGGGVPPSTPPLHPDNATRVPAATRSAGDRITTTLPSHVGNDAAQVGSHRVGKCDKTGRYGLTDTGRASYFAPALIGENRGRGAGKGR